jgi:hypothetical protein
MMSDVMLSVVAPTPEQGLANILPKSNLISQMINLVDPVEQRIRHFPEWASGGKIETYLF